MNFYSLKDLTCNRCIRFERNTGVNQARVLWSMGKDGVLPPLKLAIKRAAIFFIPYLDDAFEIRNGFDQPLFKRD